MRLGISVGRHNSVFPHVCSTHFRIARTQLVVKIDLYPASSPQCWFAVLACGRLRYGADMWMSGTFLLYVRLWGDLNPRNVSKTAQLLCGP